MSAFNHKQFYDFIARQKFPPNHFQLEILKSIAFGEGNILVNALAGSGKTSLLIMAAQLLKEMGVDGSKVMFLAFNKKIRDEMNDRLPQGFEAVNSHRLGLQVLSKTQKSYAENYKKWREVCDPLIKAKGGYNKKSFLAYMMLKNLCSKAMMANLKMIDLSPAEAAALPAKLMSLAAHFGIGASEEDDDLEKTKMLVDMIALVPKAMQRAKEDWQKSNRVSFDEMIYLPVALNLPFNKMDYVFVDECQDLNAIQLQLALLSNASNARNIFVGDIKQSIYGFSGADADSFKNIQAAIDGKILPLNICYRCPTSHLDLARAIVPEIENGPDAIEGQIDYVAEDKALDVMKRGSLIMCRLTAPLVSTYFKLIGNYATKSKESRIPVKMLGKDIAKSLGSILDKVNKMPAFIYPRITEFLSEYEKRQMAYLTQKDAKESQISQFNDSIEVLHICVENFTNCHSIAALKEELKDLFGTDADDKDYKKNQRKYITLLTVHRAKGLEAEQTAILKPDKMPLVWKGQQDWEFEQEMNILYVALTRSKKQLIVFGEPGSIQSAAKPDQAKNNARKMQDIKDKVIDGDITDSLPDVLVQAQTIINEVPAPSTEGLERRLSSLTAVDEPVGIVATIEKAVEEIAAHPEPDEATHDPLDMDQAENKIVADINPKPLEFPQQATLFDPPAIVATASATEKGKAELLHIRQIETRRTVLAQAITTIDDIGALDKMIELLTLRKQQLMAQEN
jgi:superfamily I DNA/RNA helicase